MKRFTLLVLFAALLAGCGDTPVPAETTIPGRQNPRHRFRRSALLRLYL